MPRTDAAPPPPRRPALHATAATRTSGAAAWKAARAGPWSRAGERSPGIMRRWRDSARRSARSFPTARSPTSTRTAGACCPSTTPPTCATRSRGSARWRSRTRRRATGRASRLLRAAKRHGIMPIGFISAQLQPQRRLPNGQITFLLTRHRGLDGAARPPRRRVRRAARRRPPPGACRGAGAGGHLVSARGDDTFAVFERAPAALEAALAIQRGDAVRGMAGRRGGALAHRLAPRAPGADGHGYVGLSVHAAARICFAAHGGQIVLSPPARRAPRSARTASARTLGRCRFRGLPEPVEMLQADGARRAGRLPAAAVGDARLTGA